MILSPMLAVLMLLRQSHSSEEIYQILNAKFPDTKIQHVLIRHDTDFEFKFFADEAGFSFTNIKPLENQKFSQLIVCEIISKIKLHTNVNRRNSFYIIKYCSTNCQQNHKHGFSLLRGL